ncbi:MAG: ABC transporter ATP-binding protein [Bacilli bacterium]|nr:ABC transporter ATP-binding protein [Bacilli bacterium]
MIECRNLTKSFGDLNAVDNFSLEFQPGVTGVVGENGAGKSTLFRTIAGIYEATCGEVYVDGHPSGSKEAKLNLFFLSDTPYAPHGATPVDIIDFYKGLHPLNKDRFLELIRNFGLPERKSISNFSKGMRRQVFIALALSMDAQYLLLDEAFDGLDPLVVEKIKGEIIQEGEAGKTILISSHNMPVLQRLADRFVLLHKGKISKDGKSEDIGTEFVKYQAAFKSEFNEEILTALGYQVVSFKRIGSVYHFVLISAQGVEEKLESAFHPLFLEKVAIDPDELIVLEMMLAEKGDRHA